MRRKVFWRLALTEEGEGCCKPWLCTRRCKRGEVLTGRKPEVRNSCWVLWCVFLGGWSLPVECFSSERMQTFSWALPPGCVLWSLWIIFNIWGWHCYCSVGLFRSLGNASQFSFKCILFILLFLSLPPLLFSPIDCLTLSSAFACGYYFMTRHDEPLRNFCKFKIIFTLAPVKISDNCR